MTDFKGLNLAEPILRAIEEDGYITPTPIQAQSIPILLEGHDLLGVAQTGTGKTAAFALPTLNRLAKNLDKATPKQPRALILAPTRELAGQISDSFRSYSRHMRIRTAVVFGGVSIKSQIRTMNQGVHILVATPGRLIDLMNQGYVQFNKVEMFVLDEADRMLDMGFIRDVKRISAALPKSRQTAQFSATMPKDVQGLANSLLNDPVRVEVAPAATTAEKVDQRMLFVTKDKKRALLSELLTDKDLKRVLVFTRTKHGADRVTKHLIGNNIQTSAIHGNKSQNARQRALKGFKNGNVRVLVATDIAARGIDVEGVTHVINFDLPNEPESYVHRIGRTARAGAGGIAISFCDREEKSYLRDIERVIRQSVPVREDHSFHSEEIANDPGHPVKKSQSNKRRGGGFGRGKPQGQGQGQRQEQRQGQGQGQNHGRPNHAGAGGAPKKRPNNRRRKPGGGNSAPSRRAA